MFQPLVPLPDPALPRRQVKVRPVHTAAWARTNASAFIALTRGEQQNWYIVWDYLRNEEISRTDLYRPEILATRVADAELLATSRCVLASDNSLLFEGIAHTDSIVWRGLTSHCDAAALRNCFKQFHRTGAGEVDAALVAPAQFIDEEVIYLGGGSNFGHFLYQCLLLAPIIASSPELQHLRVIVGEDLPNRFMDFLALAGIARERLIRIPVEQSVRCRQLWLITLPVHRLNDQGIVVRDGQISQDPNAVRTMVWPDGIHRFRAAMVPYGTPARRRRRLLLSRAHEAYRRITNEDEIAGRLAPLGFETINLARYSAREQVEIVSSAEIMIGAIGAGMSISLLSPGDCAVVQLTGQSVYGLYNSHIPCLLTRQPFVELLGTYEAGGDNMQRHFLYRDFMIDAAAVENAARVLLKEPH